MSPAGSSRRAAAAAPYVRRKTRQSSRTGSAETRPGRHSKWKEPDADDISDDETSSYGSGSLACWESEESEDGEPITELMEDIFAALDRLQRRDKGKRRQRENPLSV